MNLKVWQREVKEKRDARGVVSEEGKGASKRTITNVEKLELDYQRNVFTVQYRASSGMLMTEHGELYTLYPDDANKPEWITFSITEPTEPTESSKKAGGQVHNQPAKT